MVGPLCAMMIDDYGAEVVEIERVDVGDDSRTWPQYGTRSTLGDGRWELQSRFKDPVVIGRNGEAAPSESLPRSGR